MVKKYSYQIIKDLFAEKECGLLTSEEEFNVMKNVPKCKFRFMAKCGHENDVTFTNFVSKGSGIICKNCVKEHQAIKLKDLAAKHNGEYCMRLEHSAYEYLRDVLSDEFEVMKTNEGCLADFLVKPFYEDADKWLQVQLKSTTHICHNLYSFRIDNKVYTDCTIICVCNSTKDTWLFDWRVLTGTNKLNIGVTEKSSFHKYKMKTVTDLKENIHLMYAKYNKYRLEYSLNPINYYQQREQSYRKFREKHINYLTYKYPSIEGLKHDFIINGKFKVQEKVVSFKKEGVYFVSIYTNAGKTEKKRNYKSYSKGDNDFYWIWLDGSLGIFYIFPESAFIANGIVDDLKDRKRILCLSDKTWTKEYKYSLNDKERIMELFQQK